MTRSPHSPPAPWSEDEVRGLTVVVLGSPDGSVGGLFQLDDEWLVSGLAVDEQDGSVVNLELRKIDSESNKVILRCHSVKRSTGESPYFGIADAFSVTLHELAGAIGLDKFS